MHYPYTIVDIYDFDRTISREHTAGKQDDYEAKYNTKSGLDERVVHKDNRFSAVATFHQDPRYVLSYFLPLLKLEEKDVEKTEVDLFEYHQFTKFYFKDCPQPFIVATPRLDNYEKNRDIIWSNGKNLMLTSLRDAIPSSEYHYYDDTEKCYVQAYSLNFLHCYHVNAAASEFSFLGTRQPGPGAELENYLNCYLLYAKEQLKISRKEGTMSQLGESLRSLSIYAKNSSEGKEKEQEKELESSSELVAKTKESSQEISLLVKQIPVIKNLIQFLDSDSTNEVEGLELLSEGELGSIIKKWELKAETSLEQFISQVQKNRVSAEGYVSGEDYDDLSSYPL